MIFIVLLGISMLMALAVFQLLLIAGKPLGRYAWGGQHETLPSRLRIASAFSILLYAAFGILLLNKAGYISIIPAPFVDTATWVVTCYFGLGIIMNTISRSKKERIVMTPAALLLALTFLLVALN